MSDAVVLVVAAGFALMGAVALVRPADLLSQFGVAVETAEGTNEVRAVYGGFGLAVAALLALAAVGDPATRDGLIIATACALAGMAAGRLFGAALERPRGVHPVWTYFAIEVVSACALVAAA